MKAVLIQNKKSGYIAVGTSRCNLVALDKHTLSPAEWDIEVVRDIILAQFSCPEHCSLIDFRASVRVAVDCDREASYMLRVSLTSIGLYPMSDKSLDEYVFTFGQEDSGAKAIVWIVTQRKL